MISPKLLAALFLGYMIVWIPLIGTLMPPFQAADEFAHAQRADEIALGEWIGNRSPDRGTAGGIAHEGLPALAAPFDPIRFHPERKLDSSMRATEIVELGGIGWQPFPNTAIYPPIFYLPAAAGFVAARALHLTSWHAVILARLLTGVASAAIAAGAILLADAGAPLLFALLCLPMSVALFGAISQDGPMIASAALGCALLLRAGSRVRFWVGCALLGAVAMARPVYLPLCVFPLLAPSRSMVGRIGGAIVVAGAGLFWVMLSGRLVLPAASSARIAQQMTAILRHPGILWTVFRDTVSAEWRDGLPVGREFIGVLGWLDTPLPRPFYALAGCVLLGALGVSRTPIATRAPGRAAASLLAIAAMSVAIYATQYLSWSAIGGTIVEGVQGRYFLPLAPFLLFAMPSRAVMIGRPVRLALTLFPAMALVVTVLAIRARYDPG